MKVDSWPFIEAGKILQKIGNRVPDKGFVLFETGYGPSGLPHIGTFSEVVRTNFVRYAFSKIAPHIPTRLFVVSDDMDGMRRIPDHVPNKDMLKLHIGKPLTSVPDPYETHESYGHNMNHRLRTFLDNFGFEYQFISSTEYYREGKFDTFLTRAAERYDALMNIMLPTLGLERRQTYSPFMPIDPETNIVIEKGVIKVDPLTKLIHYYDHNNQKREILYTGGGAKLQWKCDFGMRWAAFNVDYEIYGKDHYPNEAIYQSVCATLSGGTVPINFFYELFLDQDGKKISKSKGNGLTIDEWLRYANIDSLAYYMFGKPKTAKRLYFDIIPKVVDEYLNFLKQSENQSDDIKLNNPITFIHQDVHAPKSISISFSLLLNVASACNPENDDVLWRFIAKYDTSLMKNTSNLLDHLVRSAMHYYKDFVLPNKQYRAPSDVERFALQNFAEDLANFQIDPTTNVATSIQSMTYRIAADCNIDVKTFFTAIYQVLLGQNDGPRVGSFVEFYGIDNMIALILDRLKASIDV